MPDMHYGVFLIDGRWTIVGKDLHYGSYDDKGQAQRAARRLAELSSGLSVQIHFQEETGLLHKGPQIN